MTDPRTGIDLDRSFLDQPFSEPPRPSFLTRNGDLIALAAMLAIWAVGLFGIWSLEG